MTLHYHPRLKELLGGNNPNSNVAINKSFADWQTRIEKDLKVRCGWKKYYNYDEEEKALFRFAQEHRQHFQQEITADEVLILVHPLYLPLTHMHLLKTAQQRKEVDDYLKKLPELLERVKRKQQQQVVVMDTLYHYAATTSLLLENGLVNGTVFTQYDNGKLYDTEQVERIGKKELFVSGAYNDRCLKHGLEKIAEITPEEKMMVIPEFVFDHPEEAERGTLKPQRIIINNGFYDAILSPRRYISIEDLIKRWGI